MKLFRIAFIAMFFLSAVKIHADEEMIDLLTFIHQRTHQYPLPNGEKIFLLTPPRTGSTLVYNVLRFLFMDINEKPWYHRYQNLVIKDHDIHQFLPRFNYVVTIRNPVDACISLYRTSYPEDHAVIYEKMLDLSVNAQLKSFRSINKILERRYKLTVLHYEDFVDDFDFLLKSIESAFSFTILPEDKELLRKALSKKNVKAYTERFSGFEEYDHYSNFHGNHIHKGTYSENLEKALRKEVNLRLASHSAYFASWGYTVPEKDDEHKMLFDFRYP